MGRRARGSLSREEILAASLQIIRSDGLDKLTMRNIARRLGCSVASPYAYYEDRDAIIRALIFYGEQKLTEGLREAKTAHDDVYEQLEAIARTYWVFAVENRDLHKLMFQMTSGVAYRRIFPRLPTSYRVFLETIRRGVYSGEIHYPPYKYRSIARTMWSWMYGLITSEMAGMLRIRPGEDPIGEGIELFSHMLRHGERESFLPNIRVRDWYDERVNGIKRVLNRSGQ